MDFWSVFFKESLQNPCWEIFRGQVSVNGGQERISGRMTDSRATLFQGGSKTPFPDTFRIFVFPPDTSAELHAMMEKMVSALGYKPDEVSFLGLSEKELDKIENSQGSRNILFFGDQYPGLFGEFVEWSGHKIMKTHGLDLLKEQPELKKKTWGHLQKYSQKTTVEVQK